MAVLHLLSNPSAGASCLAVVATGDALLLLGDGVFAHADVAASTARLGVLRDDAAARGVSVAADIQELSQAEFVDWVVAFETSVTWT